MTSLPSKKWRRVLGCGNNKAYQSTLHATIGSSIFALRVLIDRCLLAQFKGGENRKTESLLRYPHKQELVKVPKTVYLYPGMRSNPEYYS